MGRTQAVQSVHRAEFDRLVELVDQLRTPRRYNRCQSRNAVGKRNSVLDAEPLRANTNQPSLLAIQWQCRWEPPHGPALEAAGSVDAGAEIQPALPGVARWGRIAFSRIFFIFKVVIARVHPFYLFGFWLLCKSIGRFYRVSNREICRPSIS